MPAPVSVSLNPNFRSSEISPKSRLRNSGYVVGGPQAIYVSEKSTDRRMGPIQPSAAPDPRERCLEISEANSAGKPAAALFPVNGVIRPRWRQTVNLICKRLGVRDDLNIRRWVGHAFGSTSHFCETSRLRSQNAVLNSSFLILSSLIFESSVEGGMPSLEAAPPTPATLPLLSARADSIISFS